MLIVKLQILLLASPIAMSTVEVAPVGYVQAAAKKSFAIQKAKEIPSGPEASHLLHIKCNKLVSIYSAGFFIEQTVTDTRANLQNTNTCNSFLGFLYPGPAHAGRLQFT